MAHLDIWLIIFGCLLLDVGAVGLAKVGEGFDGIGFEASRPGVGVVVGVIKYELGVRGGLITEVNGGVVDVEPGNKMGEDGYAFDNEAAPDSKISVDEGLDGAPNYLGLAVCGSNDGVRFFSHEMSHIGFVGVETIKIVEIRFGGTGDGLTKLGADGVGGGELSGPVLGKLTRESGFTGARCTTNEIDMRGFGLGGHWNLSFLDMRERELL